LDTVNLGFSLLVYGESKAGKSWLGDTAPAPRLVLDAEGGSRFTPSKKVTWNPALDPPPEPDGSWETCIVAVNDFATIARCYDWLASGQHPFESVVIDSISETQQRAVDSIAGVAAMQVQDWGTLLRQVSDVIRKFRDLLTNPVKPLQTVVFIAMIKDKNGKRWPLVQGSLADFLPFYVDAVGYLFTERNIEDGQLIRRLLVSPHEQYLAGERLGGRLGDVVDNPDISHMLAQVAGPQEITVVGNMALGEQKVSDNG
jgi:AAA domain-containing protein